MQIIKIRYKIKLYSKLEITIKYGGVLMYDMLLTPQQLGVRDKVRNFVKKSVSRQLLFDMDAEKIHYPRQYIESLADDHLLGLRFPAEWGGAGLDWEHEVLALEEIGVLGASLA